MINFVSDEGITETRPSKILGFVRYNIFKGIPTPQYSGNEELSSTSIGENHTVDNNLYVVAHTASDYISLEQLQYDFITSCSLGNITDCVYIVNVDTTQVPYLYLKIMDLPVKIGTHLHIATSKMGTISGNRKDLKCVVRGLWSVVRGLCQLISMYKHYHGK